MRKFASWLRAACKLQSGGAGSERSECWGKECGRGVVVVLVVEEREVRARRICLSIGSGNVWLVHHSW